MNKLEALLKKVNDDMTSVEFSEVIETVDTSYTFTPTAFKNGDTQNDADQNNGSCKVFAFGKINDLNPEQTLNLFGDYYRKDVLDHPENDDHQNIRNFIKYRWEGISFEGEALAKK